MSSDLIVAGTIGLSEIRPDGDDLYWVEMRPIEGGRYVIVRRGLDGRTVDVTPSGFNARSRVHEYGGGAYTTAGRTVWFSNFDDQRFYRQIDEGLPSPITGAGRRYADAVVDARRGLLFAVREDHGDPSREAQNTLVRLGLGGEEETVIASGADFYSDPRLAPGGDQLCWLQWNHPHMPWDGTELWVADVNSKGDLEGKARIPGSDDDAIYQPQWSPAGVLHFVSDRSGWWNLHSWLREKVETVLAMDAEFGSPQWVFGQSNYCFAADGVIVAAYSDRHGGHLGRIAAGVLEPLETQFTAFRHVRSQGDRVTCVASSPTEPPTIISLPAGGGQHESFRRAFEVTIDRRYFSIPQAIDFPTEGGKTAHAFFYPPHNPDHHAPEGELPPLVVHCHGGPTSASGTELSLSTQYWTSRGIGVVDVNYGGSTGYGTDYRRRLNGQWGVVDVDDCVNAARDLVSRGQADARRVAISGGSAGGYTTLAALTMRDFFRAGADHFGLSDLIPFAHDTHKFESRYLESLIGPIEGGEELYRERSPLTHVDNLNCPLIVFQGLEDQIVPPNQSEFIVAAARRKGLPVTYLAFEGEQHGFRQGKNIKRTLDGELSFYSQVFDFAVGDDIEPVEIENL